MLFWGWGYYKVWVWGMLFWGLGVGQRSGGGFGRWMRSHFGNGVLFSSGEVILVLEICKYRCKSNVELRVSCLGLK